MERRQKSSKYYQTNICEIWTGVPPHKSLRLSKKNLSARHKKLLLKLLVKVVQGSPSQRIRKLLRLCLLEHQRYYTHNASIIQLIKQDLNKDNNKKYANIKGKTLSAAPPLNKERQTANDC